MQFDRIDLDFIQKEIKAFESSKRYRDMINGINYFNGKHDILKRKRTAIGEDGKLIEVDNLPNNRVVDNQYKKLVLQKANYILGNSIGVSSDNEEYQKILIDLFDSSFDRTIKTIAEDALNCGIAWMLFTFNGKGEPIFKRLKPTQVIPGWKDEDHSELEYVIRFYKILRYEGSEAKTIKKVEFYDSSGVHYFEDNKNGLIPCEPWHETHFYASKGGKNGGYNWDKIPIIPFKYNQSEKPLVTAIKCLQDGLNSIFSNFQNSMEEDARNTILIIKNYDGEDLGQFRRNLATYGVVKVSTFEGEGGVETLRIDVDAENYKTIIQLFRRAIIENGMGYDSKDDRLLGQPNEMNIKSMYSDIDLDSNGMELEFQASLENLLWFINAYLYQTNQGDFEREKVQFNFERSVMINEAQKISMIRQNVGILSRKTLLENHPWVTDVPREISRLEEEHNERMMDYGSTFKHARTLAPTEEDTTSAELLGN